MLLALGYLQWQAMQAAALAAALCARFAPGDSVVQFVQEARVAGFAVRDDGPGSRIAVAARDLYRLSLESYRCTARHDGVRIIATEATKVILD